MVFNERARVKHSKRGNVANWKVVKVCEAKREIKKDGFRFLPFFSSYSLSIFHLLGPLCKSKQNIVILHGLAWGMSKEIVTSRHQAHRYSATSQPRASQIHRCRVPQWGIGIGAGLGVLGVSKMLYRYLWERQRLLWCGVTAGVIATWGLAKSRLVNVDWKIHRRCEQICPFPSSTDISTVVKILEIAIAIITIITIISLITSVNAKK